jgi:tRNA (guanine-N7-)-methyltransferase
MRIPGILSITSLCRQHRVPYHNRLYANTIREDFDSSIYDIDVFHPHPRTEETAMKHCEHVNSFLTNHVLSYHTKESFKEATSFVDNFYGNFTGPKHIILDSGVGTGRSTLAIAAQFPNFPVIGVDRSIVRLNKNKAFREQVGGEEMNKTDTVNYLFVRADLVDFYMLAYEKEDWVIHSHYLLYPNPYPKSQHLKRRFHGHPVFPIILALGGYLTVRSNWHVYVDEMEIALKAVLEPACQLPVVMPHIAAKPLTNFEAKYSLANIPIYELQVNLGHRTYAKRVDFIAAYSSRAWPHFTAPK